MLVEAFTRECYNLRGIRPPYNPFNLPHSRIRKLPTLPSLATLTCHSVAFKVQSLSTQIHEATSSPFLSKQIENPSCASGEPRHPEVIHAVFPIVSR